MAEDRDFLLTPEFRLAFPSVFEPTQYGEQGKPKYTITMLFPKDVDITSIKQMCKQAVIDKWGADQSKWPTPLALPFGDGDTKQWDGFPGCTFVRATSLYPPGLVDQTRQEIIDRSKVYGGAYGRAQVNAYSWEFMGKYGVSVGLQNLQILRDGEPFGNRQNAADAFDDAMSGSVPETTGQSGATAGDGDIFN